MLRYFIIIIGASVIALFMKMLDLRFAIFIRDYRIDFHANLLFIILILVLLVFFYGQKVLRILKLNKKSKV
jgi:hypothetical protein